MQPAKREIGAVPESACPTCKLRACPSSTSRLSSRSNGKSIRPESQETESLIGARLQFEDKHYSSLNLGLFDDDRLIGYVLAHLDDGTEFPGHAIGDNVYVADIAVRPLFRRHLIRLLQAFAREVRIEYPGLPVVAHSIRGTSESVGTSRRDHTKARRGDGDAHRRRDDAFRRHGLARGLASFDG